MKSVKAPPDVRRLVESLRDLGYDPQTAIADLIDNSIAADATRISVEICASDDNSPAYITIADNGTGMDRAALLEAMRFGVIEEHGPEDLGKYGLGLKTASLSQCRRLTVISKPKPRQGTRSLKSAARWELDNIYSKADWDLLTPDFEELDKWERDTADAALGEYGTVVTWCGLAETLPLLSAKSARDRELYLASLIKDVRHHLSMVFHRFMQGVVPDRRKVEITVCGDPLEPWDPFCRKEETRELEVLRLSVTATKGAAKGRQLKVSIAPFLLPGEREFSSPQAWSEAGRGAWNQRQGFYFYRNDRLLQAGGWSNLRAPDEHSKLLRVAVNFTGILDEAFSVNVSKMRARIPAEIRETVRNATTPWVRDAKDRYANQPERTAAAPSRPQKPSRSKGPKEAGPPSLFVGPVTLVPSNAPSPHLAVAKGARPGSVRVVVPMGHDLAVAFKGSTASNELKKLCATLMGLLEAVAEGRMKPSDLPIHGLHKKLKTLL